MSENIAELAREFRTRLILAHPGITKRLRPGLPREMAIALAGNYGVTLTEEALAYFSVLDGFDDPYRMPQIEVQVFPGRYLESLEGALTHYKGFWYEPASLTELYSDELEEVGVTVPPLRFVGEDSPYFYALDLEGEGRPVWSMFREMGLSIAYLNLEALLKTQNSWLREEVLVFTGTEWSFTSNALMARIGVAMNPGVENWEEQLKFWGY